MIVIVDYGMGNLGSIVNTLKRLDYHAIISSDPKEIQNANKIILPGVGSFDKGMYNLNRLKLVPILKECALDKGTDILGICLGMQLLSTHSEEGDVQGLGLIDAKTVMFKKTYDSNIYKIPHMGWNSIIINIEHNLLNGVTPQDRFYFAHSYHIDQIDKNLVLGTTDYGCSFPSVIRNGNIFGIQCHPERSHSSGIKVLQNFIRM